MLRRYFTFGLSCLLLLGCSVSGGALAALDKEVDKVADLVSTTADHSRFAELDKPFVSGSEVTRACLKCHNQAASQVHTSIHWTWESNLGENHGEGDTALGKAHVLNNY